MVVVDQCDRGEKAGTRSSSALRLTSARVRSRSSSERLQPRSCAKVSSCSIKLDSIATTETNQVVLHDAASSTTAPRKR